jgi:hypothetical protein
MFTKLSFSVEMVLNDLMNYGISYWIVCVLIHISGLPSDSSSSSLSWWRPACTHTDK